MSRRLSIYSLEKGKELARVTDDEDDPVQKHEDVVMELNNMATFEFLECMEKKKFRPRLKPVKGCKDRKEWYIADRKALLTLIEAVRMRVVEYYRLMLGLGDKGPETPENSDIYRMHFMEEKLYSWEKSFCIDTEDDKMVSGGDSFEYCIFDLIFLLKRFDWENRNLYFCID